MLTACGSRSGTAAVPTLPEAESLDRPAFNPGAFIKHVVIIVQENRSFDNLFNGFPGANTAQSGQNSEGQTIALTQVSLAAPYDLLHTHPAFETEYAGGLLNGFNLDPIKCNKDAPPRECPAAALAAYAYVSESDVQPYWDMASSYTIADNMFETNQGPSFPAHQYLVSGTSTISNGSTLRAAENPLEANGTTQTGGCDSPAGSTVLLIDQYGNESQTMFPCFDRISLMERADAAGVSWRYYQTGPHAGLWHAPDALRGIRYSGWYSDVVPSPAQVLTDIAHRQLASIVWVTPTRESSDHPGMNNGTGPSWVASIVNAIGKSKYWSSTAIFVVWDDWGGWYDHVPPTIFNSYELGFRVPLLVISPYAKASYVSNVQHEFGSILKFTEETFNLPSLGTTDVRADDLSDCFNFKGPMHRFNHIRTKYPAEYFLHRPPSDLPPDDD